MTDKTDYEAVNGIGPVAPPRRKWYKRKLTWFLCLLFVVLAVILIVLLVVLVGVKNIMQGTIDDSDMRFRSLQINQAQNGSMALDLDILLGNTGSHKADLTFPHPVQVWWKDQELGSMAMDPVTVDDNSGSLVQRDRVFKMANETLFAQFVGDMLSSEEFEWVIKSSIRVHAMGYTRNEIDLTKYVKIPGMNGLHNITVIDLDMPGDAKDGGIVLSLKTDLQNPSPFGINLGLLRMGLYKNGTYLGPVEVKNATLTSGSSIMEMEGRLLPQKDAADAANLQAMMAGFLAGDRISVEARGVTAYPDGQHSVSWLAPAVAALKMEVPLAMPEAHEIIKSITLGDLDLDFSGDDPAYAPRFTADSVVAGISLPFDFSLDVKHLAQAINMTAGNATVAALRIADAPLSKDANNRTDQLVFDIPTTALSVPSQAHPAFDQFVRAIAMGGNMTFGMNGGVNITAQTPAGTLNLTQVPFNVNSSLAGMQGLASRPVIIESLDVVGGTADALLLSIAAAIDNPSRIQIGAGDVTFQLLYQNTTVGDVAMEGLTLARGTTHIKAAAATLSPDASSAGKELLSRFVAGETTDVVIAGSDQTSKVSSLNYALAGLRMPTTIPGLNVSLIPATRLTIKDDTTSTGVAAGGFTVLDPFAADLRITAINATMSVNGATLGQMSADISGSPLPVTGKSTVNSPDLPLQLNLTKDTLMALLQSNAQKTGTDLAPLQALLALAAQAKVDSTKAPALQSALASPDTTALLQKIMGQFTVDLEADARVLIGDYATALHISEKDVPCKVDQSLMKLLPLLV
ncbi:hypothetical protein IWQ60_006693 [Tieghemiomyces parasiticus]|uniref:Uncharacterized protein n=1 Tax=Tieghemiomyces parasiticus TaxID=78921 RepID=A0A9W8A8B8_9FUNG|nr:hypothetical protein IWQ60_006693 [Tieghemiomyces parasiticus]